MMEEKFHKTKEKIEKIMSGFDEVGSYGIALVENEIRIDSVCKSRLSATPKDKLRLQ
jgi:hypothetical protein